MAINGLGTASGSGFATQADLTTAGGMVLIASQSVSAVSSVSINNCFTSTYDNYRIMLAIPASGSGVMTARLRSSGVDATGANYIWGGIYMDNAGGPTRNWSGGATTSWTLGSMHDITSFAAVDIFNPAQARVTNFADMNAGIGSTASYVGPYAGVHNLATAYDGITIYSGVSFTGLIRVYGYRNNL